MKNNIGKIFNINLDKEGLKSIGIYEGEEIIDSCGVLLQEYKNGICVLNVSIKYTYNNNEIIEQRINILKENISLK